MLATFLIIFGVERFVFRIKFILLDAFLSIVQCLFCCILCLIVKFSSSSTSSLFSWYIEQNARDAQMTTRVTEGARRER